MVFYRPPSLFPVSRFLAEVGARCLPVERSRSVAHSRHFRPLSNRQLFDERAAHAGQLEEAAHRLGCHPGDAATTPVYVITIGRKLYILLCTHVLVLFTVGATCGTVLNTLMPTWLLCVLLVLVLSVTGTRTLQKAIRARQKSGGSVASHPSRHLSLALIPLQPTVPRPMLENRSFAPMCRGGKSRLFSVYLSSSPG